MPRSELTFEILIESNAGSSSTCWAIRGTPPVRLPLSSTVSWPSGQRLRVGLVEPEQVAIAVGCRRQVHRVRLQGEGRESGLLLLAACCVAPSVTCPLGAQSASAAAPAATSLIVGTPACWAAVVSTPLQSLPPSLLPPLVATTTTTITSARSAAAPTMNCVRRLPLEPPRPLKKPATREANPGPFGAGGAGRGLRSRGRWLDRGSGRGRGRRRPAAAARLGDLGELRLRREQAAGSGRAAVRGRSPRDRSADGGPHRLGRSGRPGRGGSRSGRPGRRDRRRRSRAGRNGPGCAPRRGDPEQRADVLIALPTLEQQLEHRALFVRERHGRGQPRAEGRRLTQLLTPV